MADNISIGVKIHDIHHGLIQSTGAIVESEYAFLKELGIAIQIATTIKDHETIKDLKPFYAASGELKIPRQLANAGLAHLDYVYLNPCDDGFELFEGVQNHIEYYHAKIHHTTKQKPQDRYNCQLQAA